MDFPPYIAFTAEDQLMTLDGTPDTVVHVITCLTATLTQAEMPARKDLYVYGDDITIGSALSIVGQNMTIVARKVTLLPGASVDLSGWDAVPTLSDKAENGAPGASAQNPDAKDGMFGNGGNGGENGGNLVLVGGTIGGSISVTSKGGNGSKGQNGGDGGTGLDGARGDDYRTTNDDRTLVHDGLRGVNGGREGAGGVGGPGGIGANGGTVTIGFATGPAPGVAVSCPGGAGGPAGKAGANGGRAGQGGAGGANGKFIAIGGKGGSFEGYVPTGDYAPGGSPGAVPSGPSADGKVGPAGNPGSTTATLVTAPDFYGSYAPSIQQLMLALRQAEFLYLGQTPDSVASAADRLLWISTVTTPPTGVTPPATDPRAQMRARANALLTQIARKLDFYGQPANHVPLASLAYYQTTLPGLLASGTTIEASYNAYVSEAGDQVKQIATLQGLLSQNADQLTTLKASRQPLVDQIGLYQAAVSNLLLSRNLQGVALATTEVKWEASVISQLQDSAGGAQCKTYMDIAGILGNVVTMDGDAFEKLANDGPKFGKSIYGGLQTIADDQSNWENAVARLDTAQGDVGSVVAAANDLVGDAISGDSGKIAVDRATFSAMLVPYKSLDGTGALEAQINLYLAKAQAFSQKQLDYNALQIQLLNLDAKIAQKQAEHDSIQNQLSNTVNPEIAIYKAFAARTYGETLDALIRDVYGLYQAYRYWALADYTFPPGDGNWTMAYLSGIQVDLNTRVTAILDNFSSTDKTTTQTFDYRAADGAGWVIDDATQLADFRTKGAIDFSILLDDNPWVKQNFAGFAQVVATDFVAEVRGATLTSGQLFVRLTHSGQAPFVDPAGTHWLFSHVPVSTSYKYDIASGGRLAGGALSGADHVQIGLSPFTTWTLRVIAADNPDLSLAGVDRITIKFKGRYLQTDAARRRRGVAA